MKLPFNIVLAPMLRPYLGCTRIFCQHSTFSLSIYYTYLFAILGFFVNASHLKKHLGEYPPNDINRPCTLEESNFMMEHDLKIIATSMGLVQYACLIVGCMTENPALFLPHLLGQLMVVMVKILNLLFLMTAANIKAFRKLIYKVPVVMLLIFNWSQEFCVFRQFLCICDL